MTDNKNASKIAELESALAEQKRKNILVKPSKKPQTLFLMLVIAVGIGLLGGIIGVTFFTPDTEKSEISAMQQQLASMENQIFSYTKNYYDPKTPQGLAAVKLKDSLYDVYLYRIFDVKYNQFNKMKNGLVLTKDVHENIQYIKADLNRFFKQNEQLMRR